MAADPAGKRVDYDPPSMKTDPMPLFPLPALLS
jgi:hypothetical protein